METTFLMQLGCLLIHIPVHEGQLRETRDICSDYQHDTIVMSKLFRNIQHVKQKHCPSIKHWAIWSANLTLKARMSPNNN